MRNGSTAGGAPRIAIIGAGLAGLACARRLKAAGADPVVFEKSRGVGGRVATRSTRDGWRFDHGAQFVTARSDPFRTALERGEAGGTVKAWRPAAAAGDLSGEGSLAEARADGGGSGETRYVGAPAMNSFIKPYADGLDLRLERRAVSVRRDGGRWLLETAPEPYSSEGAAEEGGAQGAVEPYDVVICAAPAPQAAALARDAAPDLSRALASVRMSPCWAAMIGFGTRYEPGFDAWRSGEGGLSWICRNASKPGRDPHRDGWVVHASPDWSLRFLEADADAVLNDMIAMFRTALPGPLPDIDYARAHRWRYALTTAPLGAPYAEDASGRFFAIGDWCLGARVEFAFQSGDGLGAALAARLQEMR